MPSSSSYTSSKGASRSGSAAYLLFLTHHLLSSTKQSQLRSWAKDLSLVGLAKRGYPGVILLLASSSSSSSSSSVLKRRSSESQGESQSGQGPGAHLPQLGAGESVARLDEVGRRIKRMQWASQDLRPVRPLRSSTFASLQKVLAERQGGEAEAEADQQGLIGPKGRLPPLLFLESMKEISLLFQDADQLAQQVRQGEAVTSRAGREPLQVDQELWRDIWRREMKPR